MSNLPFVESRVSDFGIEYNVSDLYSKIKTRFTLEEILDKMIEEDYIGKRMEYIPKACITEFVKIAECEC